MNLTLFRTSPHPDEGDFTPEDPLAIDYVGQQLGNDLWPGFTTRTDRAGYYVMVCYGLRIVDEIIAEHGLPRGDLERRRQFGRWERLWAVAICSRPTALPTTTECTATSVIASMKCC